MELPKGSILVAGPVIIENQKVLLNREKGKKCSSFFMFPGGKMDDTDKTLEDTCIREAKEELGIDIEIIQPLRTLVTKNIANEESHAILVHFLAKRLNDVEPGDETIEWGWYDVDNLPENCAPNVYEILEDIKKDV